MLDHFGIRTVLTLLLLKLLIEAFGLRAVKFLNRGWIELYVRVLPESERVARRYELLSDLSDKVSVARKEGYSPTAIAVQLLVDMIPELMYAVMPATSALLAILPGKLERGSEAVGRYRTPALAVAILGMFLMVNFLGLVADGENQRNDLLMMNSCLIGVATLFWKQEQRWAKIVLVALPVVAILGVIACCIAIVIIYRGYEHPLFGQWIMEAGVTMLPVVTAAILTSDAVRKRLFRGNWCAVGLCVAISVGISIALAFAVAQSPETIILVWLVVVVSGAFLVGMAGIFAVGTDALCTGLLKSTAFAMRVLAAVVRRLR